MAYDFETLAVSRLTGQFGSSPKVQALMAELVGPLTTLESVADTLRSNRWIDSAVGVQLDGCGAIVGELREGRSDDAYRTAIRFRVFVNISKGTPVDLLRGLKFLTTPTESQYLESYPATVLLYTNGFFIDQSIQKAMQDLAAAGISIVPVAASFMGAPFRFESEPPPGELFVNGGNSYLTAEGSDIQVTMSTSPQLSGGIGGCVPAELEIGGGSVYLDVGGPTLAVYNPNSLNTLGHNHLTGVFQ